MSTLLQQVPSGPAAVGDAGGPARGGCTGTRRCRSATRTQVRGGTTCPAWPTGTRRSWLVQPVWPADQAPSAQCTRRRRMTDCTQVPPARSRRASPSAAHRRGRAAAADRRRAAPPSPLPPPPVDEQTPSGVEASPPRRRDGEAIAPARRLGAEQVLRHQRRGVDDRPAGRVLDAHVGPVVVGLGHHALAVGLIWMCAPQP